jgi:hypothetical protein
MARNTAELQLMNQRQTFIEKEMRAEDQRKNFEKTREYKKYETQLRALKKEQDLKRA